MVSELGTERCVGENVKSQIGVDCVIPHQLERGRVPVRMLGTERDGL